MQVSEKYPDYDDLVGFHLSDRQLGEVLRMKSRRALRGELSHRDYLKEVLEFLSNLEGTFEAHETEAQSDSFRFGRQVEKLPGDLLYVPNEDSLAERAETATAHLSGRLEKLQGDHPEAFEDTVQGVLAVTRQLDQANPDREALIEELFAILGEDPLVVTADHSVEDGRVHVTGAVEDTTGAGLFRPDPEAVAEAHAEPPDPSLGEVSVTEEAVVARNVVLPDGGHLAVVATTGKPLAATEYRAPGEYDELTVPREHFETDSGEALVMLFKGAPDEEFDLTNTPYSVDRQLLRQEVSL